MKHKGNEPITPETELRSKYYRIGGLVWELIGPDFADKAPLSQFLCSPAAADHRVEIGVAERLSVPQLPVLHREDFITHYDDNGSRLRVHELEHTDELLLTDREEEGRRAVTFSEIGLPYYNSRLAQMLLDLPRQMLKFGGVFLHASYICTEKGAILFTAPKQTGKSTQAELWRKFRGAEVVNGDRALLRVTEGVWTAFGSPYCGTSDICKDITAPIRAVVVLGQGPENTARLATPREGLAALLNGMSYEIWDREQAERVMTAASGLLGQVPVIKLDCRPDEGAVSALEELLWKIERN